ncbi:MAG: argininosuccinate lyase [Planctomycetaceae bacterium]|nr:MAG: argininosuccinate lyase [Planctomycetaceae bacterium]
MHVQNYRDIKPDTHSRLRGKEIPSLEEGRKAFAALAYNEIPRATKVHKAWTVMLIERGIIDKGEGHEILKTLNRIDDKAIEEMIQSYDPNFYKWRVQFERYLMDKVGSIAGNINIGRTLPPPLYRMKLREAVVPLIQATLEFRQNLLDRAEEYRDAVMPGYTHNQHAQPMTFGHYLLGLYEAIDRAAVQLEQAYDVINICDLGCGALAGTSFNVDREKPARFLGFDRVMEHTNDCVASTDQATNVVPAMINLAIPMSRVANEMHWWATFEFNMIELTDAICEASSMMPQKKSPCVFEEIRCTLGKVLGCYSDIVCRAQNTLYGDTIEVYEASEYVPNTVADVIKAINTFNKVLNNLIVKKDIMLRHAQRGFSTATELAAFLFRETHLPLRVAHAIVGESVHEVWEKGGTATDINTDVVDRAAVQIIGKPLQLAPKGLARALDATHFVEAHKSQGAVAPKEVHRMVTRRRQNLKKAQDRHAKRCEALKAADQRLEDAVKKLIGG